MPFQRSCREAAFFMGSVVGYRLSVVCHAWGGLVTLSPVEVPRAEADHHASSASVCNVIKLRKSI
jgi:hypothetical protein